MKHWQRWPTRADRLIGLSAWLDQLHAQWSDQLASFKRHAEATDRGR